MPVEIERKFLLSGDGWKSCVSKHSEITQGYLSRGENTVRVRLADGQAYLTIKSPCSGITRAEYEYPIPVADAHEMLADLCEGLIITKTRHLVPTGQFTWEIDVFHGPHQGLIVAELELPDQAADFDRPDWLGQEVSADPRYRNSYLASHPFTGNP